MSANEGIAFTSPRAAMHGGDFNKRLVTLLISSLDIASANVKFLFMSIVQKLTFCNLLSLEKLCDIPIACMKYSGRFLEPVARTCLPISSNATGRCSRFISSIDCNCFFALYIKSRNNKVIYQYVNDFYTC